MREQLKRYQQAAWAAGVLALGFMAACAPYAAMPQAGVRAAAPATGPAPAQAPAQAQAPAPAPGQAAAPAPAAPAASTDVQLTASEFKFAPGTLSVPVGKPVTLTLANKGVVEHDLTVDAPGLKLAAAPGQTAKTQVTFDKPGTYEFYCSIPGHKDAGMKGTLTVGTPPAAATTTAAPATAPASAAPQAAPQAQPTAQPLPPGLGPLPAPQIAPPVARAQPATVRVDLETQEVTALLADGVAYRFWTFNGTVPGPMIRVRQGDTVELHLKNNPASSVTHSIDLHAVTGPGGGATVMQVAPGNEGVFTFKALNPGVYVYHCATPMVSQHIAMGMYGLIVVEPPEGLPKVDREFYLMQGDFYLQGQRGEQGLRGFDLAKLLDERPDYVAFNGGATSLVGDRALKATVGETVRFFFGVGGPNLASSFHVIGEIFDRVAPEGATDPVLHNVQTTMVPPGGATMAEMTLQVPGTYTIVDHSLGRLEKGGAGQLVVSGPDNPDVYRPVQSGSPKPPAAG